VNTGNRAALALTALACALALPACGSSSSPSASGSSGGGGTEAQLVHYSACMRGHGVSGFPDPSTTESGSNGFGIDGYNFNLPSTMNTHSPAYESAATLCGKQVGVGPGSGGGHGLPAAAKQAALRHAECMRTHGVPNYPDPTFSSNGGITQSMIGSSGVNRRSPAFQQAEKDCSAGG
jgi:hypothetical protein